MTKTFYTLITLTIFLALSACQPLNRAAVLDRKAERAEQKGNVAKAVNQYKQAAQLDKQRIAANYTRAAALLFGQGQYKKAFRLIERIPPCEVGQADCSDMDIAHMYAWKGSVALQMGLPCDALRLSAAGLVIMDRHHLTNDSLRATLLCNQGVADVYCQAANGQPGEEIHFKNVHRRDFQRSYERLVEACRLDDDNCIAAYNKLVLEVILSVPIAQWDYGYLADSIYPQLGVPYFDCLPEPAPEPAPYSFNRLTEELSQKQELVLVLDISGSMGSTVLPPGENVSPITRIQLMKAACDTLLSNLDPQQTEVGAITIGGSCGRVPVLDIPVGAMTPAELNAVIQQLPLNGGTPLDERVLVGLSLFTEKSKTDKAIFLFSDGVGGCTSYRRNICGLGDELKDAGVEFYAFALLLEGGGARRAYGLLNCIVESTNGLLLGVDEKAEVQDATIEIDRMPVPIPLFINEIAAGQIEPFDFDEQLQAKVDSLTSR